MYIETQFCRSVSLKIRRHSFVSVLVTLHVTNTFSQKHAGVFRVKLALRTFNSFIDRIVVRRSLQARMYSVGVGRRDAKRDGRRVRVNECINTPRYTWN